MASIAPSRNGLSSTRSQKATSHATNANEPATDVSPEIIAQKFDLAIALVLYSWDALTVAVQNSWGGPTSGDKRDWFAGAISELFDSRPDADIDDVEDMLVQVMADEFDLNIEDGSEAETAAKIVGYRKLTRAGDFKRVDGMLATFQERQKRKEVPVQVNVEDREEEGEWDDGEEDDEEEDGGVDVDMEDAPQLVQASRPRPEPEIDEEGFTKVVGKKKR